MALKQLKKNNTEHLQIINGDEPLSSAVRQRVISVLQEKKSSFNDLLSNTLNCDPALLLRIIESLVNEDRVICKETSNGQPVFELKTIHRKSVLTANQASDFKPKKKVAGKESRASELAGAILSELPDASPVFSQWWFTAECLHKTTRMIQRFTTARDEIGFLACPTLGALTAALGICHSTILDRDQAVLSTLEKIVGNRHADWTLFDATKELASKLCGSFSVLMVDPPWGQSSLKTFLIRSAALVKPGGVVLFSLPPEFTRPGIQKERGQLTAIAQAAGLQVERLKTGYTSYSVPTFEKEAYRTLGITLNTPWRRGDLFVLRKTNNTSYHAACAPAKDRGRWEQYRFGESRVFLKRDGTEEDGPLELTPCADTGSLHYPSTSSRSAAWKEASLVTTRNKIAHAYGRRWLADVLRAIDNKHMHTKDLINLTKLPRTMLSFFDVI